MRQGEELAIRVPGLTLAARAWGNPEGRPFFALHGWLDNANTYNRLAPLLPELNLVALDFPGHGRSDHHPEGVHYNPFTYIQALMGAARALGWERFGVIGHSMGAGIASEAGGMFPECFTEIVLLDGLVHNMGTPGEANGRNRQAIEQMLDAGSKQPPVYADPERMAQRVAQATDQSLAAARELIARGHKAVEGGVTWRTDPRIRFATPLRVTVRQLDEIMAATTAPTFLLMADKGDRWYRDGVERRAKHHPNLTIEELGGPHHFHLEPEHANLVATRIRDFLGLANAQAAGQN